MKINPKQMEKVMRQMGVKMEQVEAEEVLIRTAGKTIVISSPQVSRVNMMGQETFQITGEISERPNEKFSAEDVRMVMDRTGATEEQARAALEETGDLAEAIVRLKSR
jgi:nascent polypeptide-associated complex subunit alpha